MKFCKKKIRNTYYNGVSSQFQGVSYELYCVYTAATVTHSLTDISKWLAAGGASGGVWQCLPLLFVLSPSNSITGKVSAVDAGYTVNPNCKVHGNDVLSDVESVFLPCQHEWPNIGRSACKVPLSWTKPRIIYSRLTEMLILSCWNRPVEIHGHITDWKLCLNW